MKFKKGDNIVRNSTMHTYHWAPLYEVKDIANGDLYADQYYILQAGARSSMHDVNIIDETFQFSLRDALKNL